MSVQITLVALLLVAIYVTTAEDPRVCQKVCSAAKPDSEEDLPIPKKGYCRYYCRCSHGESSLQSCYYLHWFDPDARTCRIMGRNCNWYIAYTATPKAGDTPSTLPVTSSSAGSEEPPAPTEPARAGTMEYLQERDIVRCDPNGTQPCPWPVTWPHTWPERAGKSESSPLPTQRIFGDNESKSQRHPSDSSPSMEINSYQEINTFPSVIHYPSDMIYGSA